MEGFLQPERVVFFGLRRHFGGRQKIVGWVVFLLKFHPLNLDQRDLFFGGQRSSTAHTGQRRGPW